MTTVALDHTGAFAIPTTGSFEVIRSDTFEAEKPGFAEEALPQMDAVYRFALRLAQGDRDEAEDIVQETFLRAYRWWHTYNPNTKARSWLFTICRNVFLNSKRRPASKREVAASKVDASIEELGDRDAFNQEGSPDPERLFFDSFVDEEVLAAIDQLPEPYREVVVLSDLENQSYAEIAETLDIPLGTVQSRLYRARRQLQKSLYDYAVETGYIKPLPLAS